MARDKSDGFLRVEDLDVHRRPCDRHLEACELTRQWPSYERAETLRHLFIARREGCLTEPVFAGLRERYRECIRAAIPTPTPASPTGFPHADDRGAATPDT